MVVSDSAAPVAKSGVKLTNERPRSPTKLIDVAEEWGSSGKRKGGDNSQMRKNLKFASDSVQTGALEQNIPIVGDDNLEVKEESGMDEIKSFKDIRRWYKVFKYFHSRVDLLLCSVVVVNSALIVIT